MYSAELRDLVAGGAVHLSVCPLQATTIDASNVKFGICGVAYQKTLGTKIGGSWLGKHPKKL